MRKFVNSLFLLLLLSSFAAAQTVVARKTINLWPDPSTAHEPIAKIAPSVRLRLLDTSPTNGFYHVKADDGKEGWVLGTDIVSQRQAVPTAAMSNSSKPDLAKAEHEKVWLEAKRRREVEEAERKAEYARLEAVLAKAKQDEARAEMPDKAAQHDQERNTEAPGHASGSTKPNFPEGSHQVSKEKPRPSATPSAQPIQRPTTSHTGFPPIPMTAPMTALPVTSDQGPAKPAAQHNQSPEEKLQQAIGALQLGQEVFHHPEVMEIRKPETVQVRISHDLEEDLTKGFESPGVTEHDQIRVSTIMKVHLAGDPYFDVKPISDERQLVMNGQKNEWSFTVVPLKGGKYPLHLLITAVIHTPWGTDEYKDFPVKDEIIFVRVTPLSFAKSFLAENWQWLWTTIFIPLVALFWKKRKRKTKGKQSTAAAA